MSPNHQSVLLPTLLAPPAKLFSRIMSCQEIVIDIHETYPKQTLRNRYYIGSPNDVRALVVPVHRPAGHSTRTKDTEIDYSTDWPAYHRKSLTTAYSKSPFFLYYADYIFAEYERRHKLLADLNTAVFKLMMNWTGIKTPVRFAEDFIRDFEDIDMRPLCKSSTGWDLRYPYYQPFDSLYGFRNALSVFDILFNLGPEAAEHLKKESDYADLQSS